MSPLDETSEAAQAFERYDLVSAPVVDEAGRLVGRLTIDEVVDVIREEGEDAALAQAGLREEEDLFASVWNSARNRWLWLAVNLVHRVFRVARDRRFRNDHRKSRRAGDADDHRDGDRGKLRQSDDDADDPLARSGSGDGRQCAAADPEGAGDLPGLNGLVWGSIAGLVAWWIYVDSPRGWLIGLTLLLAMVLNMLVAALVGTLCSAGA